MNSIPVTLKLDASPQSSLDWKNAILQAKEAIEQNTNLIWELDFGLFYKLRYPISNGQQFLGLRLAIEHFADAIWAIFAEHSLGVILFQGCFEDFDPLVDTENFQKWIQAHSLSKSFENPFFRLLCARDLAIDYIGKLARQLPQGANPYILLEKPKGYPPVQEAFLFNPVAYRPLEVCLLNQELNSTSETACISSTGILLPSCLEDDSYEQLNAVSRELSSRNISHRFLSEEGLITQIQGLDSIIIPSIPLSTSGKRQLLGFCAAGGQIVSLRDTSMNFLNEISFKLWLRE